MFMDPLSSVHDLLRALVTGLEALFGCWAFHYLTVDFSPDTILR